MAQQAAAQSDALLQEARRAAYESDQRRIQQQQHDAAVAQKLLEDERARFRQATAEQAQARDEAVGAERQSVYLARQAAEAEAARRLHAEAEAARLREMLNSMSSASAAAQPPLAQPLQVTGTIERDEEARTARVLNFGGVDDLCSTSSRSQNGRNATDAPFGQAQLACAMILDVARLVVSARLGARKRTPIALQDAPIVTRDGREARALPAQPRLSRHPRVRVLRLRPAPPRARPIVPTHSIIACHLLQGWELTAQHARLKSRRKKCLSSVRSVELHCGRTPRHFAADAELRA